MNVRFSALQSFKTKATDQVIQKISVQSPNFQRGGRNLLPGRSK